jgi:hypothetical protein
VVGPGGLNQLSIFNGLHLQTFVSVRFEAQGILGAFTNLEHLTFSSKRLGSLKGAEGLYLTYVRQGHSE